MNNFLIDWQTYAPPSHLFRILFFLVTGILAGCGSGGKPQRSSGSELLKKLTGGKLQTTLSPDSVVMNRIKLSAEMFEESLTDFKPLTGEHLAELQTILDRYGASSTRINAQ